MTQASREGEGGRRRSRTLQRRGYWHLAAGWGSGSVGPESTRRCPQSPRGIRSCVGPRGAAERGRTRWGRRAPP
jgi:hypothetical protein